MSRYEDINAALRGGTRKLVRVPPARRLKRDSDEPQIACSNRTCPQVLGVADADGVYWAIRFKYDQEGVLRKARKDRGSRVGRGPWPVVVACPQCGHLSSVVP